MNQTTEQLTYSVPSISCGHCRAAITAEVQKVPGVTAVDVDVSARRVSVTGESLHDAAIRGAIDAAGYDVA
jgi:copper chaperone CopZ